MHSQCVRLAAIFLIAATVAADSSWARQNTPKPAVGKTEGMDAGLILHDLFVCPGECVTAVGSTFWFSEITSYVADVHVSGDPLFQDPPVFEPAFFTGNIGFEIAFSTPSSAEVGSRATVSVDIYYATGGKYVSGTFTVTIVPPRYAPYSYSLAVPDTGEEVLGVRPGLNSILRTYWSADEGEWQFQCKTDDEEVYYSSLIKATDSGGFHPLAYVLADSVLNAVSDDGVCLTVTAIPSGAVAGIAMSNGNGVFGITDDSELLRFYYSNGAWHSEEIPHFGGDLVASSLITGDPAPDGNVYGVNENGILFATYRHDPDARHPDLGGYIAFATIDVANHLVPSSIAVSNGSGIFGVTTAGKLVRVYHDGTKWLVEEIAHFDGDIVADSLITGGPAPNGNVYGVNQYGQLFGTYPVGGETTGYGLIYDSYDLVPSSIAVSNGINAAGGIFGITKTDNKLERVYHNGTKWLVEIISHSGGSLVANSLTTGDPGSDGFNVYGINENGRLFATWVDPADGRIKFVLIP